MIDKKCPRCQVRKPLTEFAKNKTASDGKQTYCRPCSTKIARESRQRTGYVPKKISDYPADVQVSMRAKQRDAMSIRKYGMTRSEVDELVKSQGGCLICKRLNPLGKGWHVDHDHACCPTPVTCGSCIRGILCSECNTGLGKFTDNPASLRRAAEYLIASRADRCVLTVGTFDLPHAGHLALFKECRKMAGDRGRVVAGVNTSEFVKLFKHVEPAMTLTERVAIIGAIEHVDEVVVNEEGADLKPLLERVSPSFLVVGDDWAARDYLGQINASASWLAERGISIIYVPRNLPLSTTIIKERVRVA